MTDIKFSKNWNNKLNGVYFTTIRLNHKHQIGDKVNVWLNKNYLGVAQIIDKKRIESIYELDEYTATLDTGLSCDETLKCIKEIYSDITNWTNQGIYVYLLKYLQKSLKNV